MDVCGAIDDFVEERKEPEVERWAYIYTRALDGGWELTIGIVN